ncbi:MAG: hypothetical protein AAB511_01605 [Patescibacteria group bacterium]
MRNLLLLLCAFVAPLDLFGQTTPTLGTFPTGSTNAVYQDHLGQSRRAYAVLYEFIPGPSPDSGNMGLFSQQYTLTNTAPALIKAEIQTIANETAKKAPDWYFSSRTNQFTVRVFVEDAGMTSSLLEVNDIFYLEQNGGVWRVPPSHTPESIAVNLAKAGSESWAPYILVFNFYTNLIDVKMYFTNISSEGFVIAREGTVQRNNLAINKWYEPARGNDGAFSVKGERDLNNNPETATRLLIPMSSLTNGLGEIKITLTNASGISVVRYRLDNGSRIASPMTLSLSITNSLPTLYISGEQLSRIEVQQATNLTGVPSFVPVAEMIISTNGTATHVGESVLTDRARLHRVILR